MMAGRPQTGLLLAGRRPGQIHHGFEADDDIQQFGGDRFCRCW
jgi:hypothetical protein